MVEDGGIKCKTEVSEQNRKVLYMPRVSVVMASYNHERYVAQAVESVLNQTYNDFEFIITDDASSDKTVAEIKQFRDPRIRLFCFEKNQGQFAVINHCLDKANGEYIAIINSDDIFLPDKLEKQARFLDEHPEIGAVFGQARIIDDKGNDHKRKKNSHHTIFIQPNRTRFEWLNYFFYKGNCLCHPSVLIRKKCHEVIGYYNERFAQIADIDMWIRLCMKYEIYVMPEKIVEFRIHGANTSAKTASSMKRWVWEWRQILDNYLNIKSVEFLHKVFPDARQYGDDIDDDLIPFILAMIAINTVQRRQQIYRAFAIDTIYRMLGDKNTAAKLAKRFNFIYSDFIKLTGQHDVFSFVRVKELQSILRNPLRAVISSITGRGSKGKV